MKEIIAIEFNSKLENVSEIETILYNIKYEFHLQEELYFNLKLATLEAVTNAIEHGNNLDVNKKVNFSVHINQEKIKICIKDEGEGFDIEKLADPTLPENKLEPDGRGVFLMKKLADDIIFDNKGSSVEMHFYF